MLRLLRVILALHLLIPYSLGFFGKERINVVLVEPSEERPVVLTAGLDQLRIRFALIDNNYDDNDVINNRKKSSQEPVRLWVRLRSSLNRRVYITVAHDITAAIGQTQTFVVHLPVNGLAVQPKPHTIAPVAFHVEVSTRRFYFFQQTLLSAPNLFIIVPAAIRLPSDDNHSVLDHGRHLSKHEALVYLADKGINSNAISYDCLTSVNTHSACLAHRSFIYRMSSTIKRIEMWMATYNVSMNSAWPNVLDHPHINEIDAEITDFLVGHGKRGQRAMRKMVKRWNKMARKTKQPELVLPDDIVSPLSNNASIVHVVKYLVVCRGERWENHMVNIVGLVKRSGETNLLQPLIKLLHERQKTCRSLQKRDGHGVGAMFVTLLLLKILVQVVAVLIIVPLFFPKPHPYWHYQNQVYYEPRLNNTEE